MKSLLLVVSIMLLLSCVKIVHKPGEGVELIGPDTYELSEFDSDDNVDVNSLIQRANDFCHLKNQVALVQKESCFYGPFSDCRIIFRCVYRTY